MILQNTKSTSCLKKYAVFCSNIISLRESKDCRTYAIIYNTNNKLLLGQRQKKTTLYILNMHRVGYRSQLAPMSCCFAHGPVPIMLNALLSISHVYPEVNPLIGSHLVLEGGRLDHVQGSAVHLDQAIAPLAVSNCCGGFL